VVQPEVPKPEPNLDNDKAPVNTAFSLQKATNMWKCTKLGCGEMNSYPANGGDKTGLKCAKCRELTIAPLEGDEVVPSRTEPSGDTSDEWEDESE
jgi:hypothetical protein